MKNFILNIAIKIIARHIKHLEKKYKKDDIWCHHVNTYRLLEAENGMVKHTLGHYIYTFDTAQAAIFTRSLLLKIGACESQEVVQTVYEKKT